MHPLIADKIEELVKDGYSDVGEVQHFLGQFVQSMFKDNNYYPEKTTIPRVWIFEITCIKLGLVYNFLN